MGKDDPTVFLRARIEALETDVRQLAQVLGATVARLGALNIHVGLGGGAGDPDTPEAFKERAAQLDGDIREILGRIEKLWPDIKEGEGSQN